MEYKIKHDELEIVINSKGAEQEHLFFNGKDYMRRRDSFWNRKAPVLFPIVGSLKDLKTYINGELFSMTQHGFARDREFELFKQEDNKLIFVDEYDDNTLKLYPFKYQLFIEYSIEGRKLEVRYKVVNKGKEDMYFNIGGHPGFNLPMYEKDTFEDYKVEFMETESWDAPTVSNGTLDFINTIAYRNVNEIKLNYKLFEIDAVVIPNIKSKSVNLVNKEGKGINFAYKGFNTLAIWTRPGAPFVCLEPWKGYADHSDSDYDFIKKDDIVCLKENESYTFGYDVTILD